MSSTGPRPGSQLTLDLDRFVEAQAATYEIACGELRAGRKESHWMWFIFPQMRGLGGSAMAQHFGIVSLEEARAYLAHPVLGPRLHHVAALLLALPQRPVREILGSPDDLKLRSSMTLSPTLPAPAGRMQSHSAPCSTTTSAVRRTP